MAGSLLGTFTGADGAGNLTTGSRTSTSGSLITAHAAAWDTPSRPTIAFSDSKSNTYTTTGLDYGATSDRMALGYNANGTRGATHTVTATFSAGVNGACMVALEWAGIDAAPTVVTNTATGSASTASSVSVTAGAASTFIAMSGYSGNATTIAVSNGTEAAEQDEDATNQPENVAYKVGLSGAQTIAWTFGAARNSGAIIAAFTEATSSRTVNATTQNLTLTGQPAAVRKQRRVAATTQALTLTGQPATVGRGRRVQGTTQALALVGHPATVVKGGARTVLATTQALTLTGLSATVVRGGASVPRAGGGAFPMLRVPVYDRRIEQLEELIDDIETAAAGSPPAEINKARIELKRMAAERAQQEHDETARVKAEAAHLRRVEAIEDTLLDVLEAVLKRVMKKQKPRD